MAKCLYCGANPIPHTLEWYHETTDILFGPLRRKLIYSRPGIILQQAMAKFFLGSAFVLSKTGLLKYSSDSLKVKIPRAKVLWDEALARGIEIRELRIFDRSIDVYQAQIAGKRLTFTGLPRPENYYNVALDWVDDKYLLKKALAGAGLPVAKGFSFFSFRTALRTFENLQKPVIVKPRIGSRGRHTTTHIYTAEELKKAFKIAKQLCAWVIVEEHLSGPVWRGTVVNGKCAGVLGGDPPKVIGDSSKNIQQLILTANQNRPAGVKEIIVDSKMQEFLKRCSMNLDTVLPQGKEVYLSEKIGVSYGGSSTEVFEQAHADNIKMFEDAAAVIKDPILGFDFICEDITKSWREQRCGIIECNGLPFINLHHDPLYGKPRNVAKEVWDYVAGVR
jgi:D-alanine-D-alanine ligase-like ATP-grasp enzyme